MLLCGNNLYDWPGESLSDYMSFSLVQTGEGRIHFQGIKIALREEIGNLNLYMLCVQRVLSNFYNKSLYSNGKDFL